VTLPSSFTLSISPTNPEAGQDITITALAQTLAGVPQANVSVSVTVSSGPDSGQTLTATTNSLGIATITVRTNSTGTAVYTASALVNGVTKTVSATVLWAPSTATTTVAPTTTLAPTTTIAPTTTVEVTTTTVAPVVTTVAPVVTVAPTTTHSMHEHAPSTTVETVQTTTTVKQETTPVVEEKLPKTGSSGTPLLVVVAFLLFISGLLIIVFKKKE